MKMLRNFIPFLMAVLIAYGCNKDEQLMNNSGMKSLVASYESSMNSTKVGFEASTGDFYWSAGDAISVIDSETGTFTSMLLDESDAGSSTGTFSGYMVGNPSGYAVYPAHDNHSLSENILTFHFKSEYNYTIEDSEWGDKTGNSFNPAMYSEVIEGSKLSFRHLGGVYCLKVADFPVGNDYKLQFISNNQITGALNVDLSGDEPVLSAVESTENNVVTISFDVSANATTRVFYIPVPVGIHKGSVVVKNANDVTLINSDIPVSKQTIARRYLKTISISKKGIEGGNDNTDVPGYIADGVIYNETAGQYEISNANGLRWLAAQVNNNVSPNTFEGKKVVLTSNIDLNNESWTPIGPNGDGSQKFKGTFDGNNKVISNLKVKTEAAYVSTGLFGALGGTVKNLTIDGADVEGTSSGNTGGATVNGIAVVAGSTVYGGTISNVTVKNAFVKGNRYVAGIVGYADGTIENCKVQNVEITAVPDNLTGSYDNGDIAGGVVGYLNSSIVAVKDNIAEDVTLKGYRDLGIIVGAGNATVVTGNTVDCTNSIEVDQTTNSYGIKDFNAAAAVGRVTSGTLDNSNIVSGTVQILISVNNKDLLQKALDYAAVGSITIQFTDDITGDVTVTQKEDVNIVVDGNNKNFTGLMTVFGNGRQQGTETLKIMNINFIAKSGSESCIVSPDKESQTPEKYSYSHNVTVESCSFTDPDGTVNCAAVRHKEGGDWNWSVNNCKVDNTMHSLLQVNNVGSKLTIDNCIVASKNGANLNCCTNVFMTKCNFDVKGYAVRFGVKDGGNLGTPKTYTIENSNLKSACNDGDAVIMFRASAVDATLTLTETVLDGTNKISGDTEATTINGSY